MSRTPNHRNAAYGLAVIVLLLLFTGCANGLQNGGSNSDNDRNSGVYGGITGGGIR